MVAEDSAHSAEFTFGLEEQETTSHLIMMDNDGLSKQLTGTGVTWVGTAGTTWLEVKLAGGKVYEEISKLELWLNSPRIILLKAESPPWSGGSSLARTLWGHGSID